MPAISEIDLATYAGNPAIRPHHNKRWRMRDGTTIPIRKMGDRHLVNAIALLQRAAEYHRACNCAFYLSCPEPRGDMAHFCFDREEQHAIDATWEDFTPPIYDDLFGEAMFRGLALKLPVSYSGIELDAINARMEKRHADNQ